MNNLDTLLLFLYNTITFKKGAYMTKLETLKMKRNLTFLSLFGSAIIGAYGISNGNLILNHKVETTKQIMEMAEVTPNELMGNIKKLLQKNQVEHNKSILELLGLLAMLQTSNTVLTLNKFDQLDKEEEKEENFKRYVMNKKNSI